MHELDAPVQVGQQLLGKYRVERMLGQGGMGVVVQASHMALGHRVAIKFLLPEACGFPGAVERFLREARAAVQIQSEHVARVSDIGKLDTCLPYMVMEFLEGNDLSDEIRSRGPLSVRDTIRHLLEASEALAEAHALGIVHRDLKPANLFLAARKDGSRIVKVLDFGISKAVRSPDASLTQTSSILGSPLYMAPEQIRNARTVDARADVWSLGVIAHECLSGRTPFGGTTLSGVLAAIVADPPEPLDQLRPDLPPELTRIVARCLEKAVENRVQSVAELARLISPFCPDQAAISLSRIHAVLGESTHESGQALDARPNGPDGAANPRESSPGVHNASTAQTWAKTGRPTHSNRRAPTLFIVGAACVVLIAALAWWAYQQPAKTSAEDESPAERGHVVTSAATPSAPEVNAAPMKPEPAVQAPDGADAGATAEDEAAPAANPRPRSATPRTPTPPVSRLEPATLPTPGSASTSHAASQQQSAPQQSAPQQPAPRPTAPRAAVPRSTTPQVLEPSPRPNPQPNPLAGRR